MKKHQKPILIVMAGRSGAGKSTVSSIVQKHLGIKSFTTDKIRRTKKFRDQAAPYVKQKKLFPNWFRRRYYLELMRLGRAEITKNKSVILDATFSEPWMFTMVTKAAKKWRVPIMAIEVQLKRLPKTQILKRLHRRIKKDHGAAPPKTFWAYRSDKPYLPRRSSITINNDGSVARLRKQVATKILPNIKI